jgi:hypothetical protein
VKLIPQGISGGRAVDRSKPRVSEPTCGSVPSADKSVTDPTGAILERRAWRLATSSSGPGRDNQPAVEAPMAARTRSWPFIRDYDVGEAVPFTRQ